MGNAVGSGRTKRPQWQLAGAQVRAAVPLPPPCGQLPLGRIGPFRLEFDMHTTRTTRPLSRDQIPDLVMPAVMRRFKKLDPHHPIYEVMFGAMTQRVDVSVGNNRLIVGANP